jgi:hemolysin activation/secretion protein
VLDIPLNLNYTFFDNSHYKLGFTAGASSYLMLSEHYNFSYYSHYTKAPNYMDVRGQNKHYFGIANLAVSYERKLNDVLGLGISPYFKLPLTKIGNGNVKLISAGASINLNVNISKITGRK